jgi:hypothetical protein
MLAWQWMGVTRAFQFAGGFAPEESGSEGDGEDLGDPVASLQAALDSIEFGDPLYENAHISKSLAEAALLKFGLDAGLSKRWHDNLFELPLVVNSTCKQLSQGHGAPLSISSRMSTGLLCLL